MLLFILLLGILIGGIILYKILDDRGFDISFIPIPFAVIGGVAAAILLIFIIIGNVGVDGCYAKKQETYKTLIYKYENADKDELGLRNLDLLNEIQEWNEDISKGKILCHDIWIGALYPEKLYKDFETIKLGEE